MFEVLHSVGCFHAEVFGRNEVGYIFFQLFQTGVRLCRVSLFFWRDDGETEKICFYLFYVKLITGVSLLIIHYDSFGVCMKADNVVAVNADNR